MKFQRTIYYFKEVQGKNFRTALVFLIIFYVNTVLFNQYKLEKNKTEANPGDFTRNPILKK